MKREYSRPTMTGERFMANEFVAACAPGKEVYTFTCTAGQDVIFPDSGKPTYGKLYTETESFTSGFRSCNATHSASTADTFVLGKFDLAANDETRDVYIWLEPEGIDPETGEMEYDYHATENLDIEKWPKNLS